MVGLVNFGDAKISITESEPFNFLKNIFLSFNLNVLLISIQAMLVVISNNNQWYAYSLT
jgi:hypothetical protein